MLLQQRFFRGVSKYTWRIYLNYFIEHNKKLLK